MNSRSVKLLVNRLIRIKWGTLRSMPDYFCTVGYGLDHFAVRELTSLLGVTIQQALVGKVFFRTNEDKSALFVVLKTIERLFVKLVHFEVEEEIDCLEGWLTSKLSSESVKLHENLIAWRHIAKKSDCVVKFRINSRLSGRFRKASHFREVSNLVGKVFTKQSPDLIIDLEQPDLEVFLHLNDKYLTIGLQVTRKPLSDRSYLAHIAVRSTVCCAMCMAVELTSDDTVLDPMCGAATILVEAVKQFDCKFALGVDSDLTQLKLAQNNIDSSCTSSRVELICGDSRSVNIRQDCFDVVLCDVPFGRKFGDPNQIEQLLSCIVRTIDPVLKSSGRIGILISERLRQSLIDLCPNWTLLNQHPLRLGTLPAAIVTWRK